MKEDFSTVLSVPKLPFFTVTMFLIDVKSFSLYVLCPETKCALQMQLVWTDYSVCMINVTAQESF